MNRNFVLIFFVFSCSVYSQNYLWPTNASEYLSSSFCEFREGHYHSAIDIKTWNTEGYPCYAVEDGYIKQIRISPFGYGKVVYLQLEDGNTAVYAHLQKFSPKIDKKIREMQFKNKKYRLTWRPRNLKVKRGEIIAYTGRTGIGVPHLHFEIRNEKDNPINPLKYYTNIKDNIRPSLFSLAVIPLSQTTTINGSYLPRRFSVYHIKDGVYVIKEPINVRGKVGLAIKGYDRANNVYNKYGFHKTTLETSGEKVFQIIYDELDFSTTAHINTEIYYPYWSDSKEVYHKLYLEPFNPLQFYDRSLGVDGSITIKDKPVQFTINVSDFWNNRSVISGELLPADPYTIQVTEIFKKDLWAYLKFTTPTLKELMFYTSTEDQSWIPANYFEIIENNIDNPGQNLSVRVPLERDRIRRIKIEVNKDIEEIVYLEPPEKVNDISRQYHFLGNKLIMELIGIYNNVLAKISSSNTTLDYQYLGGERIELRIPAQIISDRSDTLTVYSDSKEQWAQPLDFHLLLPGESTSYSWFDSALVVKSAVNSVTDTTLLTANILGIDSLTSDIPTASKIFELLPDNFPIFKALSISLSADSLPAWGKWSVYKKNRNGKLSYRPSRIDSATMRFTTRTSSLGKFVIASDTVAPEVLIESPRSDITYNKDPEIRIFLEDTISGIGDEEYLSLSMDGEYVLPEWDPEEDVIIGILERKLTKGNHIFTVSVQDRSGNITRKAVYFKIN
jgi:hypothetical protein